MADANPITVDLWAVVEVLEKQKLDYDKFQEALAQIAGKTPVKLLELLQHHYTTPYQQRDILGAAQGHTHSGPEMIPYILKLIRDHYGASRMSERSHGTLAQMLEQMSRDYGDRIAQTRLAGYYRKIVVILKGGLDCSLIDNSARGILAQAARQFAVKIRNQDAGLVAEVAGDRDFFQKQRDQYRYPAGIYDTLKQAAHDVEGRYASNEPQRRLNAMRDSTGPKRMPRPPARRTAVTTGKPTGTTARQRQPLRREGAGLPA